jgi:hypothetical protein
MMQRFLIAILISLLLGSCTLLPSRNANPPAGLSETQSSAVRTNGTVSPDVPVITFQRSGGLAGTTETWTIFPDGRVISSQGTFQVSPEIVSKLLTDLTSLGINDMKDSYGGLSNCKDCFTYTITINSNNNTKTITTTDGATDAPAELGKILSLISDLVNSATNQ